MPDDRVMLRVKLDAQAKELIEQISQRRGMTQSALISRVIGWFAQQDQAIQSAIVGGMSDDVAGTLLKLWLRKSTTLDKAANLDKTQ